MKMLKSVLLAAAFMTVAGAVRAESPLPLPMAASPEEVGLSSVQLKRLEAVTKAHIDEGLVPGAVMLVARRGKVAWVSVQGKRDVATADPMKLDSIFRILSIPQHRAERSESGRRAQKAGLESTHQAIAKMVHWPHVQTTPSPRGRTSDSKFRAAASRSAAFANVSTTSETTPS